MATARRRTTRTTTRRRSSTAYRRRRTPTIGATLGTALGALVVATVGNLFWPARIGLILGVALLGLVYLLWSRRTEIAAEAAATQDEPATTVVTTEDTP